ncbi:MAG: PIN domain-containing protein [Desulfobacterales bacterium]
MRIVLDTNVFVSGVFFSGPPYKILKGWRDGRLQLLLSEEILEEYHRVGELLSDEFPPIDLGPFLELLTINTELIVPEKLPNQVCDEYLC